MNSNVRDVPVIPIELRIIKFVQQNGSIIDYLKDYKIRKRNSISEKRTRAILFNTYGWGDYLLFIFNPHNGCFKSDSNGQYNKSKINCGAMEISLLLWAYEDMESILDEYSNENKYFPKIKELYESLNNISNDNNLLDILYSDGGDQLPDLENVYTLKDDDFLYILTFVRFKSKSDGAITDTGKIVENFAMFDYMGIWDSVILSKIKREHIENYKLKFLTNDRLPIQQTSSIILIPW